MLMYLLIVYGLGSAWLWWLVGSRGAARIVGGVVLVVGTALLYVIVIRRGRRLASPWERIPSRIITHAHEGSRWNRTPTDRSEDPGDFEAHVGM